MGQNVTEQKLANIASEVKHITNMLKATRRNTACR